MDENSDNDDLDIDRDVDQEEDGDGEGDNDDENEENEDEDDEQDQEDPRYPYTYSQSQEQMKNATNSHNSHASLLSSRSESAAQALSGSTARLPSAPTSHPNPSVVLTSPSPSQPPTASSVATIDTPKIRPDMLTASVYDIVPTIAAPHSTSINSICAMPDLRWVFSGGADGYIRKFDWHATANGKAMLTVAQRHPFVDSVTKAGVLLSYWENEDSQSKATSISYLS